MGRLRALEDAAYVNAILTVSVRQVGGVRHEHASLSNFARPTYRRNGVTCCQRGDGGAGSREERVTANEKRIGMLSEQTRKGGVEVAFGAGVYDVRFEAETACSLPHAAHVGRCTRTVRVDKKAEHGGIGDQLAQEVAMSHIGQSRLYAEERYEPPLRRGTPWKYSPPLKASEYHLIDLCAGVSQGGFETLTGARQSAREKGLSARDIFHGNVRVEYHDPQ